MRQGPKANQHGIHRIIKQMKGRSSQILRVTFGCLRSHLPIVWTTSDFVAPTGGAPLAGIKRDIEQRRHG